MKLVDFALGQGARGTVVASIWNSHTLDHSRTEMVDVLQLNINRIIIITTIFNIFIYTYFKPMEVSLVLYSTLPFHVPYTFMNISMQQASLPATAVKRTCRTCLKVFIENHDKACIFEKSSSYYYNHYYSHES